jgi:hypothetical protein
MLAPAADLGHEVSVRKGERVLVLGTGNSSGSRSCLQNGSKLPGQAFYGSTTRSPIAVGYAIESAISFTDNYGLGIPNFVYNVAHQQFDRILVCTETPAESIDAQLLKALAEVAPVVEIVTYE